MANSSSGDSMLERCVRVLDAFDAENPALKVADIADAARLPLSTAYRVVGDMVDVGLLDKNDHGRFEIGHRAWELVTRSNPVERLRFRAQPVLDGVHSAVQQFVSLAVPQFKDYEVLFIDHRDRFGDARILANQAGRMTLFDNSSGVALLAHAPKEVRDAVLAGPLVSPTTGQVFDRAELRNQIAFVRKYGYVKIVGGMVGENTAYAVPLVGTKQDAIAALSVVGRNDEVDDRIILSVLATAGRTLSQGDTPLVIPGMPDGGQ
ncbi:helix-turn-helix domain-containing protein [Corynebacterium phoceense]|uniref:IclR family transcriptional regulator n=1 Tax=Corynebacterium phoceense TaxID=1686286 RepID=UPI00211C945A|nr:helix-turn-helix domain-containing protein [Corynebacterium phoceense]MCQ9347810.1 helix-turn-helix domain-containing protein [Corynebacterium phoceense]